MDFCTYNNKIPFMISILSFIKIPKFAAHPVTCIMPSSHHYQLNEIVDLIIRTNPMKILDIGVGFGKYGFLSREYLELWDGSEKYNQWQRQIDGIEAFSGYITPVHNYIYNHIFIGDALQILPGISDRYDLILLIDVLEHFTFEDGSKLLDECTRISRNILISVPKVMSMQETVYGNPYETHRYPWSRKDLRTFINVFFIHNDRSLICYMGDESKRISKEVRKARIRRFIIRILEFLFIRQPLKFIMGYRKGEDKTSVQ